MSNDPIKAVVVGGGLAGLSAGIKLLEERPGAKVTLYTLGHHLGGKATSYRNDDGFHIDHGFHALSTNYRRLLALLARSGLDKSKTLMLDRGTYYYDDDRTGKIAKSGTVADLLRPETLKTLSFFKLVEVLHDGKRVTGLRFALPDFTFHNHGRTKWERSVRVLSEQTATITDFDHVILAVPVDNFRELNRGDRGFWRGFPGVEKLQSVATLSLQVWTEQCVLPGVAACINALDEPLPMVIDYKDLKSQYRNDDRLGSALEWVGQETSFEHLSDEELKAAAYTCFARIPGAKDPRRAGIIHESLNLSGAGTGSRGLARVGRNRQRTGQRSPGGFDGSASLALYALCPVHGPVLPVQNRRKTHGCVLKHHGPANYVTGEASMLRFWMSATMICLVAGRGALAGEANPSPPPRDLRQAAQRTAANPAAELADRLAAIKVLGRGANGNDEDLRCLAELLAPQTPLEVQLAAVESLGRSPNMRVSEFLLSNWTRHGPKVHTAVVSVLLWRDPWLDVLREESANRPELAAAREWALRDISLRHPAAETRARAEKLRVPIQFVRTAQLTQEKAMQLLPHASLVPISKPSPTRHPRTSELPRQFFPRKATPQKENDALQS